MTKSKLWILRVLNSFLVALIVLFASGFVFSYEFWRFYKSERHDYIRKGLSIYYFIGRITGWIFITLLSLAVNFMMFGLILMLIW